MNFLEELENEKKNEDVQTESGKTSRQLWESCFKYFQHLASILKKEDKTFESEFNFVFLNLKIDSEISGPYETQRSQNDNELKLEFKMHSKLKKAIKINRNDKRSADLLSSKLARDSILSNVKQDKEGNFLVELNPNIVSIFRIILRDGKDFFIEYVNISSSSKRSLRLSSDDINEAYMDKLAKYVLGQNPELYTESISDQEITKIREKIKLDKKRIEKQKARVSAEMQQQQELEELNKENSLKAKSKRYFSSQTEKIKSKLFGGFGKDKTN